MLTKFEASSSRTHGVFTVGDKSLFHFYAYLESLTYVCVHDFREFILIVAEFVMSRISRGVVTVSTPFGSLGAYADVRRRGRRRYANNARIGFPPPSLRQSQFVFRSLSGFTIVELMVIIVIVVVLSTTVGMFVVKLWTLHEKDREEAYIREKLVEICGIYADYLSIGSSISTNKTNPRIVAKYRQEAGGVSLETGRVSRVVQLNSFVNSYEVLPGKTNTTLGVKTYDANGCPRNLEDEFQGDDTPLVLAKNLKIKENRVSLSCGITPVRDEPALWMLRVVAEYMVENDKGGVDHKNVWVERVVRLWNRE